MQVFSGKVPFPGMTAQVVPAMIMGGQRPERPTHPGLTDALWELTKRCWGMVPEDRPEMEDVIQYLKKMSVILAFQIRISHFLHKTPGNVPLHWENRQERLPQRFKELHLQPLRAGNLFIKRPDEV